MVRVVLAVLAVGVTLYAFIDCLRCTDDEVRGLPRQVWCVITLLPLVGGTAWLLYGRPRAQASSGIGPPTLAPDDDPEFLRNLDRRLGGQGGGGQGGGGAGRGGQGEHTRGSGHEGTPGQDSSGGRPHPGEGEDDGNRPERSPG